MRRDVAPTREPGGGMPKVARGQAHVKNRICGAVARGAGCGSRTRARHVREAQGTRPRGCARARLHKRLTVPSSATSAATAVIVLMICCELRSWQSDLEWKCVLGTAASEALQRRCRCDCCQKVTSSSGAVLRKKCALPRGARRVAGRLWLHHWPTGLRPSANTKARKEPHTAQRSSTSSSFPVRYGAAVAHHYSGTALSVCCVRDSWVVTHM